MLIVFILVDNVNKLCDGDFLSGGNKGSCCVVKFLFKNVNKEVEDEDVKG